MEEMKNHDIPIVEDGAYAELSFEKEIQKPLCAYDTKGQVVYVGTFSKSFCPGLRVAWLCAKKEIMDKYLVLKNASDLASSTIAQYQMSYFMEHFDMDAHVDEISLLYKHRRNVMADAIEQYFPEEVDYVLPKGGLFIWAELPEGKDTRELLKRAIAKNVTFVPGSSFYPGDRKYHQMRLNFSNMADAETEKGIQILGMLIKEFLAE
jgi:2-aminoadipate transaminase